MEQITGVALKINVGYGPELVDYSTSEKFFVKFESLSREPLSPFEEAVAAAQQISEQLGPSLTLCLSGGLDSEAMALAFIAAQVSFDVTTLRFRNDLNAQDVGRAVEFCQKHGLKQQFIDLDAVSFFEKNEFRPYLATYFCPSAEVATQLWFAEQIKRPFVWGGEAFRLFVKDMEPSLQAISEVEAVMFRLIKNKGLKAIPNFHFYSPELAWSFIKRSLEYKSHFYESDRSAGFLSEKAAYYRACGFPLVDNPNRKEKLHGFEGLKNYFDRYLKKQTDSTSYNEQYRIPINKLFPLQGRTYLSIPASDAIARKILS